LFNDDALSLGANSVSRGATFIIDLFDDATGVNTRTNALNDCTFRGAVSRANTAAGDDVITVPTGVYTLISPHPSQNSFD
jgi:hypothetical protein